MAVPYRITIRLSEDDIKIELNPDRPDLYSIAINFFSPYFYCRHSNIKRVL